MFSVVKGSMARETHVMWSQTHECKNNIQPLMFPLLK